MIGGILESTYDSNPDEALYNGIEFLEDDSTAGQTDMIILQEEFGITDPTEDLVEAFRHRRDYTSPEEFQRLVDTIRTAMGEESVPRADYVMSRLQSPGLFDRVTMNFVLDHNSDDDTVNHDVDPDEGDWRSEGSEDMDISSP